MLIKSHKGVRHTGWLLAFVFFSLTFALTLPVKANPFQEKYDFYQQSKKIVDQLAELTNRPFLSSITLKEWVTEEDIKTLEKQLPLVIEGKQEKAKEYVALAWEGFNIQQTTRFFCRSLKF